MSTDTFAMIFGAVIFIIGFFLYHWINRRRFKRRNAAGLEEFKSYRQSVIIGLLERIGKIIAWIFIIGGLFFGITSYLTRDKETEKYTSTPTQQIEKLVR